MKPFLDEYAKTNMYLFALSLGIGSISLWLFCTKILAVGRQNPLLS